MVFCVRSLKEKSKCLAKCRDSDGLWQLAEVTSICSSEQKIAVRLLTTHEEIALQFADVLPLDDMRDQTGIFLFSLEF